LYAKDTSDADARIWSTTIVAAIRSVDPDHLITIGTASQEIGNGPFRADVTAPFLDFCSVHPYPIYSPDLYPDMLLSPRMTLGAAFETALARRAGKPVMLHEYGASNTQFSEEKIADYDRLSTWSSLGNRAIGFYSWCWSDADPTGFRRAPYVRSPHETQFGVTSSTGTERRRLGVMTEMARVLASLDLDGRASHGPTAKASLPVPHEFVRPFDPRGFGLDDSPAGPYMPSEAVWRPNRDVQPLVRGWLNSFVLATRAGFSVEFDREWLDGSWPNSRLVLVPAPLTTTSNSLVHLRTNTLSGARDLHERGGTLYLSCCAETAIPELRKLAGVEITDRAPVGSSVVGFNMIADFGALSPGDRIAFTGVSPEPNHRGVLIDTDGAEVLAVDDAGNAVLTRARFGEGQTILSTYPVELLLATQPDAHGVRDQSWKLYAALAQNADALAPARVDHPDVGSHLLTGPTGGILIAVNHCPVKVSAPLVLPPRCSDLRLEVADTSEAELSTNGLSRSPPTLSASLPGGGRQANASV